jgi:hypothetical protein
LAKGLDNQIACSYNEITRAILSINGDFGCLWHRLAIQDHNLDNIESEQVKMRKLSGLLFAGFVLLASSVCAQTESPQNTPAQTQDTPPPANPVTVTSTSTTTVDVDKDPALKRELKAWTETLMQVTKQENTCLFFDLAPEDIPPNVSYERPAGTRAMKALAVATRRTWKQMDGVQTFTRAQDPTNPIGGISDVNQVIAWIASLSPSQKTALIKGELSFDQLDPQSRLLMSRVAGRIPDMSFVLLEKGDAVGTCLELAPKITYTDPRTGLRVTSEIGGRVHHVKIPASGKPTPFEPLDPADPGPLDFGKGAVMTLTTLVGKAQAAFHVHYTPVDGRVAKNWYFVSGLLTQKAFEDVVAQATTIPPLRRRFINPVDQAAARALLDDPAFLDQQIDVTDLRNRLMMTDSREMDALDSRYGPTETLSPQDFLSGKTVTVAELTDGKPGLAAYLTGMGLTPDTPLTLSASPALVIEADGDHPASGSSGTLNGQPVIVTSPNETDAGLW